MERRNRANHRKDLLSPHKDNARIITRRDAVVELVMQGLPVPLIAKQLGIGEGLVRDDFHEAMKGTLVNTSLNVEAYRQKQIAELDKMKALVWAKVEDGQVTAMDRYLAFMKHEADLLGLRAPVKIAQTDPTGEHQYVSASDDTIRRLAQELARSRTATTPDAGGTGGTGGPPALDLGGEGARQPTAAAGELEDLAPARWETVWEDENGS